MGPNTLKLLRYLTSYKGEDFEMYCACYLKQLRDMGLSDEQIEQSSTMTIQFAQISTDFVRQNRKDK